MTYIMPSMRNTQTCLFNQLTTYYWSTVAGTLILWYVAVVWSWFRTLMPFISNGSAVYESLLPAKVVDSRNETSASAPDNKIHDAIMGPTWALSAPYGPHVGPINLAIRRKLIDGGRFIADKGMLLSLKRPTSNFETSVIIFTISTNPFWSFKVIIDGRER